MSDPDRVPTPAEQLAGTMFAPEAAPRSVPPWRDVEERTPDPGVRRRDPPASHEAAERVKSETPRQCAMIANYLIGRGPQGAATWRIAVDTGLTLEQADRRMTDLRKMGDAFPLKATEAGDGHGACHIWVHRRYRNHFADEELFIRRSRKAA